MLALARTQRGRFISDQHILDNYFIVSEDSASLLPRRSGRLYELSSNDVAFWRSARPKLVTAGAP